MLVNTLVNPYEFQQIYFFLNSAAALMEVELKYHIAPDTMTLIILFGIGVSALSELLLIYLFNRNLVKWLFLSIKQKVA
jgi:hypothetical protein